MRVAKWTRLAVRVPPWVRWWFAGVALAVVLLGIAVRTSLVAPLAVIVLALFTVRSPERASFGGGAITLTGAVFLYSIRDTVTRCAEFDRASRPIGGCTMFGVEGQLVAMCLYLLVGVGLTAYAALRQHSARV